MEECIFTEDNGVSPVSSLPPPLRSTAMKPPTNTSALNRFLFYSAKTGVVKADTFEAIASLTMSSPGLPEAQADHMIQLLSEETFWLDVTAPTLEEMEMLRKCEVFAHYYFCCFRTFDPNPQSDYFMQPINPYHHTENVLYRLQRQFILANEEKAAMLDDNENEQEDVDVNEDRMQHLSHAPIVPTWVNYALLDDVTDGFAPLMNQLQMEVDSVDELVLVLRQSEQTDMLRRLGEARRRVVAAGRLLNTKPDVVRSLIKWRQGLTEVINVELAKSSNRTNDSIAWLTTMGTMLIPMHVITGIWGMNINLPGLDVDNLTWFFGIFTVMCIISTTVYFRFRPKRRRTFLPNMHSYQYVIRSFKGAKNV
ncbi:hypothetical protein BDF22DRAFT_671704 [Syncephalis plumigaleata]|nr:hypothetical protein BDF22DRAFT_671704 [Syncephalis plumigaleata]